MRRISALLGKELADLRQNRAVFLPAILTGVISMSLPFFVAVFVPAFTGERLSDSSDLEIAEQLYRAQPGLVALSTEGAIQAWIFQQFLVLLVLTPVAGSMSRRSTRWCSYRAGHCERYRRARCTMGSST